MVFIKISIIHHNSTSTTFYVLKPRNYYDTMIAILIISSFSKFNHTTAYICMSLAYASRVRSKYADISRCKLCYSQSLNYFFGHVQNLSAYASV